MIWEFESQGRLLICHILNFSFQFVLFFVVVVVAVFVRYRLCLMSKVLPLGRQEICDFFINLL